MNATLPIILNDPDVPKISKLFAKRITYKLNWMSPNQINILCPLTPDENLAKEYVFMLNQDIMPKSVFSNPNIDLFTVYLYLQKAKDSDKKSKLLSTLQQMMIEQWQQQGMQQMNQMANTSANIQMAQNAQQQQPVLSRQSLWSNQQ